MEQNSISVSQHHHHDHHQNVGRKTDRKTFSLQTYLDFLHTRDIRNLNVININKIISIHGFKKPKHRKEVEEIMRTITDPINPARSTLNDPVPSSTSVKATITLAEANKDLKLLNWQQCQVTSLKIIRSNTVSTPPTVNHVEYNDIPVAQVAAELMYLKQNKRDRSPIALAVDASSTKSVDSERSKNRSISGGGDCVTSLMYLPAVGVVKKPRSKPSNSVPSFGVKKRKPGIKRIYLTSLYNSDDVEAVSS